MVRFVAEGERRIDGYETQRTGTGAENRNAIFSIIFSTRGRGELELDYYAQVTFYLSLNSFVAAGSRSACNEPSW